MCEKKIVDLSRFFLLEAAGDSESDHQENAYKDDDNDDDAESCSYDVGYCGSSHSRNAQVDEVLEEENGHDYDDGHDPHDHDHHHDHVVDDDEMREVDDTEVTSTANSYASRKCVRSSKRKMSEVEKNKLFWEACLAS